MAKNTKQCIAYLDFLGNDAAQYLRSNGHAYKQDVCVYAVSASLTANNDNVRACQAIDYLTGTSLSKFNWNEIYNSNQFSFVKSNDTDFMCYHFQLPDITTESDSEPDVPYSYEEMFNTCVLKNIDKSTAMQYKYIYNAYANMPTQQKAIAMQTFSSTNNLASTAEFVRSDYYKLFVPETDIIHDRSLLELNDNGLASVGNYSHSPFNCLMYCVNPIFDKRVSEATFGGKMPKGFTSAIPFAIPVSICTYSQDIILAGNNVLFEPNLNGIVTVQ